MPIIYLMLTQTTSMLSRAIKSVTHQPYNHISLSMDKELTEVYSFGRLHPDNPFVGGFTREDVTGDFYRQARCRIHALTISEEDLRNLRFVLRGFKEKKESYYYNFAGLFTAWAKVPWDRPNAYFCSEFVSTVLMDAGIMQRHLPASVLSPADIIERMKVTVVYEGLLYEYLGLPPVLSRRERLMLFFHLRTA